VVVAVCCQAGGCTRSLQQLWPRGCWWCMVQQLPVPPTSLWRASFTFSEIFFCEEQQQQHRQTLPKGIDGISQPEMGSASLLLHPSAAQQPMRTMLMLWSLVGNGRSMPAAH
jgi:hypothetical protein